MKIYDLTGKLLAERELQKGSDNTDISTLASGLYIVNFKGERCNVSRKLMVYR